MTKTKNIVISGTNFWNPGDDFVRDGVIKILHELFPDFQLNFLFYNFNQDFFPQNKFSGIHNMVADGDLDQYKEFIDYIVIAGLSAGTEIKDLYNWVIKNNLTDRVFLIGAGYENKYVDTYITQEPELTIFKNAKIITSRTAKAPEIIKNLGLPFHHINCPAILSVPEVKNVAPNKGLEKLAFSIQLPHEFGVLNHACAKEMYLLSVQLISELAGEYEIEIIAHHKSEYFHFLNLFKQHNVNIPVIFSSYYQDLFEIYKNYDAIITTRLHASLFSNGFGIPGIILNDTDRHTHCLRGFPHSVWVNSKEKFFEEFEKLKKKDLSEIAKEAELFKEQLVKKYLSLLKDSFEINNKKKGSLNSSIDQKIEKFEILPAKAVNKDLPVHFFTIVLNGKPFIDYHINIFKNMPFKWHWHLIEGVADLKNDTAWSLQNGAHISEDLHKNGLSKDGTTEYLDELKKDFPENITIYRKSDGAFWNGKLEMVNSPLQNIKEECVLWEIDVDELWTEEQLIRGRQLYLNHPEKTASYFFCLFLVGERLAITSTNTYGNHTDYEWLRNWRFIPGDRWMSHEPPKLCRQIAGGKWADIGKLNPFKHDVTAFHKLIFQHYAYVLPSQLSFKEKYYGYKNALKQWENLQKQSQFPVLLKNYFDWVDDEAVVDLFEKYGVQPLAISHNGNLQFNYQKKTENKIKKILFVRTDSIGDNIIASSLLKPLNKNYPGAEIILLCQEHIAELYENAPYISEIITLNKDKYINDPDYKNKFNIKLNSLGVDLLLNSIYSREPVTDEIIKQVSAREIIGFSGDASNINGDELNKNNLFYSRLIHADDTLNELEKYNVLLNELNIDHDNLNPVVFLNKENEIFAEDYFTSNGINREKLICLFPYTQWDIKDYANFPVLFNSPEYKDYSFLVLGGKENYEKTEELILNAKNKVFNLAGKTSLLQTAALIKKSVLFVGSDTSGAHIACAVGTPNVVVMGGGHFGRFMPYSNLTSLIVNPMNCYGCNWKCKYERIHCIKDIPSLLLYAAVEDALSSKSPKARIYFSCSSNGSDIEIKISILLEYLNGEMVEFKHVTGDPVAGKNFNGELAVSPKISVITPSFNQAGFIEQTIRSVQNQDYPNFEHIIIDGGSTDGTIEILKKYSHLKWISEKDKGQSDALNKGFKKATGDIIAWVNSDDWYEPGTFYSAVRFFQENPDKNIVMGNCNLVDENGNIFDRVINYERGFEELKNYKVSRSIPTQPAILFRKKLLAESGLLDISLKYVMDYDLWMRLAKKNRFFHINKTFANYRFHQNAKIGDMNWEKIFPECEKVVQRYVFKEEDPLVSVIIPCFNYARYLTAAVESVVKQTYKNFEIIIVNDGSTDNTKEVAEELVRKYPKHKIKLINQTNSGKPAISRNNGIRESTGEYILPLDADDKIDPKMLEECVNELQKSLPNRIIYTARQDFDGNDSIVMPLEYNFERLKRENHMSYCALFSKKMWESIGGYRTNVGMEDWDFWIAAGMRGYFGTLIPKPLFLYRRHDTGQYQSDIKNVQTILATIIINNGAAYNKKECTLARQYLQTIDAAELVTVIIPTFNRPDKLKEAIASVLSQTYENFEIIIVNDAGEDVARVINQFNDSRIKLLEHLTNKGLASARNTGIKNAKGKYIAYLDDDDIYYPEHLKILTSFLEHGDYKIAYTDAYRVTQELRDGNYFTIKKDVPFSNDFSKEKLLRLNIAPVQCFMHEKACVIETGLFDESLKAHEDWEFWIRLSEKFEFYHIKEITSEFRQRTDKSNMTSSQNQDFYNSYMNIIVKHYNLSKYNTELLREQINNLYIIKQRAINADQMQQANGQINISIIIPVYNKVEFTQKCLPALYKNTLPNLNFEVIVIDNASTDGTAGYLGFVKNIFNNLLVITNEKNIGFAKANNLGVEHAKGDYILFLNNDTEPLEGWLENLYEIIKNDDEVAAVGSKLLFPEGNLQHAGVVIIEDKQLPDPLVARHIYWKAPADIVEANKLKTYHALTAACLLVRKKSFENAGGFDEEYWNGYEDVDLCFKLRENGGILIYQPESVVIHHESQSGPERFSKVSHNIDRLHKKWIGKIKPDIIIEKNGKVIETDAKQIIEYHIPWRESNLPAIQEKANELMVSIIALSYNQLEYTKSFVKSVLKYTKIPFELILIDNASNKETVDYLKSLFGKDKRIKVVFNSNNLGFPKGVNQGLKIASGKYLVIANNDILVTDGWLERMVEVAESDELIGLVGPVSNSVSGVQLDKKANYDSIDKMFIYAAEIKKNYAGNTFEFPRVAFLCTLIKKEIIDRLGGLDERFAPGNFEDDDYCLRVQMAGYKTIIAQDVFIHHFGSKSFTAEGTKKYQERLDINKKIFVDKWGADPEQIWLQGKPCKSRSLEYPLDKDEISELVKRAYICLKDEDFELVLKYLDKVFEYPGLNLRAENLKIDALFHLAGKVSLVQQKFEDAVKYFQKELDYNNESLRAYAGLGDAFTSLGNKDEAARMYKLSNSPHKIKEISYTEKI